MVTGIGRAPAVSRAKISELLDANPEILRLLVLSPTVEEARLELYAYLNRCEQNVLDAGCLLHPLEKKNTRDCIQVFRTIISPGSEHKTGFSCISALHRLATMHWADEEWTGISDAFLEEMKHLFKGVIGLSGIYSKSGICIREVPGFVGRHGREAAIVRSQYLNGKTDQYEAVKLKNGYRSGMEAEIISRRYENRALILGKLNSSAEEWDDYRWHLKHIYKDAEQIQEIIDLSDSEIKGIQAAEAHGLAFGITPFYLSLMERSPGENAADRCLRAQVIPGPGYIRRMLDGEVRLEAEDFMRETDTSPEDHVTRRYPHIAIIKPFLWCPQICVYCQRNWELSETGDQLADPPSANLQQSLEWFSSNPGIHEVLITGGDPLTLGNAKLERILAGFAEMAHIRRIRIGTRTLVTLPMRFNEELLDLLRRYHRPPHQTITIVTHVEHAYEISAEMAEAVGQLKRLGIDVLNQQVFTRFNSRRFETCFLREELKSIGITPYYLFNLKAKEETEDFKVPIARLLQEQKEEARLMPGTVRTDKPVFNVPSLGKNELNAWQDHEIIMIDGEGSRIYEFYPWEKYMAPVNTYIYKDKPIADYLNDLQAIGEDIRDYDTIWYYY
ncbi:KamA family radical SAM protein [Paenibacillus tepidiphilus]|uniref:KamA family radical SAM protein n=1 Tax=Paenibacillus tepidiphilus TaxID=2608683 RepID=UPI00123AD0EF|nr:KamA family radical SAM protein [Paenibacillus tepidiphilus]